MTTAEVVEICAGAGGQALGLEEAGFEHALAVELDETACNTLRENRPGWKIAQGDVADPALWDPADYEGVALLAGGVPCPPFTIAGKQLGATDERDLFAWAVELVEIMKPRALLLDSSRTASSGSPSRVMTSRLVPPYNGNRRTVRTLSPTVSSMSTRTGVE